MVVAGCQHWHPASTLELGVVVSGPCSSLKRDVGCHVLILLGFVPFQVRKSPRTRGKPPQIRTASVTAALIGEFRMFLTTSHPQNRRMTLKEEL